MNKVYPSAAAALQGIVKDGQLLAVGRLRPLRHSRGADRRAARQRRQGPDGHLQQRGRRRLRPRQAARHAPDQQDDLQLRRREQGVRAPVPGRRTQARLHAAGHAGREAARRRRGHPGVLHEDRRRHHRGRRQGDPRVRRPEVRDGAGAEPGRVAGQGVEGRQVGQPDVPPHRAQLQSERGAGRQDHRGRGRGDRRDRHLRPRHRPPARHLRAPHRAERDAGKAHRATHRHQDGRLQTPRRQRQWLGRETRWRHVPPRNCRTAST